MPRWLWWTSAALLSWGLWAVVSKWIGEGLSPEHSQALSTLGILPVAVALAVRPRPADPGRSRLGIAFAVVAGVVTSLGNLTYYAALQKGGPAATVIPLTALYPVVTIALAMLFLRERLRAPQILGVALSLLATYLFNIQREQGLLSPAVVLALPPIAFWGCSGLLQKVSTHHVSGETSALWFLAASIPVSLVLLMSHPLDPARVAPRLWVLSGALGLFLAFGNFAILAAFASGGKASIIAPLGGLYPLVSVPIAIVFLGERIGPREGLGLVAAVASVVALSLEPGPPSPCQSPSKNS